MLKVKTELDYETNKSSTCIVIAVDQPGNLLDVRSASATFSISITDVNDNPPVVTSQPEQITIKRDIEPNTEILTEIAATDKDSEVNSILKYILGIIFVHDYKTDLTILVKTKFIAHFKLCKAKVSLRLLTCLT